MKKTILLLLCLLITQSISYAQELFQENNRFGIKKDGEIVIPAHYDSITILQGSKERRTGKIIAFSYLLHKDNKVQYTYVRNWKILPEKPLDAIIKPKEFSTHFIAQSKGKWGVIRFRDGVKWHIPPSYSAIQRFDFQYFIIQKKKKWGMTDLDGNIILPIEYTAIAKSPIGYTALVKMSPKKGYQIMRIKDGKSELLLPDLQFDRIESDFIGYKFYQSGKVGLFDLPKGVILPAQYDSITTCNEKIDEEFWEDEDDWGSDDGVNNYESPDIPEKHIQVILNGKKGLFQYKDDVAVEIFPPSIEHYEYEDNQKTTHFIFSKEGKKGIYVPSKMKLSEVAYNYSNIQFATFSDYLIVPAKDNKVQLIDLVGNPLLPNAYRSIKMKNAQQAIVQTEDGSHTYLLLKDRKTVELVTQARKMPNVYVFTENGKQGICTLPFGKPQFFKKTIPADYDKITYLENQLFKLERGKQAGITKINVNAGKCEVEEFIPVAYEQVSVLGKRGYQVFMTKKGTSHQIFDGKTLKVIGDEYTALLPYLKNKNGQYRYFIGKSTRGKWGLITLKKDGWNAPWALVNPISYDYDTVLQVYPDDYLIVEKNGKKGLLYRDQLVLAIQYDAIDTHIPASRVMLKKNRKWGEITLETTYKPEETTFYQSLPFEYDKIEQISNMNSSRLVYQNGKVGLVGRNRKLVLPIEYDYLKYATSTSMLGKKGNKAGEVILATGKMVEVNEFEKQFSLKWKVEIGKTVFRSNIMFANQQIVVGSNGTTRNKADAKDGVFLIEATSGKIQQRIRPQEEGKIDVNGQAIDGDKIFFGNENGNVYCYNFKGEKLWEAKVQGEVENSPALADFNQDGVKDAVFATDDAFIYALDGTNGQQLWRTIGTKENYTGYYTATPAVFDISDDGIADVIIGPGGLGGIYAFNGKDGSMLWNYPKTSGVHASINIFTDLKDTYIAAYASYGGVYYFNKRGDKKEQLNLPIGIFSTPIHTPKGYVITGISWWDGKSNSIHVAAPFSTTATAKKYSAFNTSSTGIIADLLGNGQQQALMISEIGECFLLDESGELIQKMQLSTGVEAPLFVDDIDNDGKLELVIAGLDGFLYCYDTNSSGKVFQGQFRSDNANTGVIRK